MHLASFDLQVASIISTKVRVNWPRNVGRVVIENNLLTPYDWRRKLTDHNSSIKDTIQKNEETFYASQIALTTVLVKTNKFLEEWPLKAMNAHTEIHTRLNKRSAEDFWGKTSKSRQIMPHP